MLQRPDQVEQGGGMRREPMFNVPASVLVLIAAFIAIHLWRLWSHTADDWMLAAFAFIPARYSGGLPLLPELHGLDAVAEVTSCLTYAFLHADWMHLGVNSLWMLAFGSAVARHLGPARFLAFSAVAAVAGALVYLPFHWGERSVMIGASGAISGQMAAAVRLIYAPDGGRWGALSLRQMLRHRGAIIFLGVWAGINALFGGLGIGAGAGEDQAIAWQAHLGGFLAGLVSLGLFERGRSLDA